MRLFITAFTRKDLRISLHSIGRDLEEVKQVCETGSIGATREWLIVIAEIVGGILTASLFQLDGSKFDAHIQLAYLSNFIFSALAGSSRQSAVSTAAPQQKQRSDNVLVSSRRTVSPLFLETNRTTVSDIMSVITTIIHSCPRDKVPRVVPDNHLAVSKYVSPLSKFIPAP